MGLAAVLGNREKLDVILKGVDPHAPPLNVNSTLKILPKRIPNAARKILPRKKDSVFWDLVPIPCWLQLSRNFL